MTKDILRLEKQILDRHRDFRLKGRLMFVPPVRPILRGIIFETSSFDKTSFLVTAFMLPLCVPTNHLYLNFGHRIRHLGGGDRWRVTKPDLVAELDTALKLQAIPFLSSVKTLGDFVEVANTFAQTNPNTQRAIAYSLIWMGRVSEGTRALNRLLDQLETSVPWQLDLANEAKQLRTQLVSHPTEAMRQLQAWELETEQNLGFGNEKKPHRVMTAS